MIKIWIMWESESTQYQYNKLQQQQVNTYINVTYNAILETTTNWTNKVGLLRILFDILSGILHSKPPCSLISFRKVPKSLDKAQ